jgi:hypothetical protein
VKKAGVWLNCNALNLSGNGANFENNGLRGKKAKKPLKRLKRLKRQKICFISKKTEKQRFFDRRKKKWIELLSLGFIYLAFYTRYFCFFVSLSAFRNRN